MTNGECGEKKYVGDEEYEALKEGGREQVLPRPPSIRQSNKEKEAEKRPSIKSAILSPSAFALGLLIGLWLKDRLK